MILLLIPIIFSEGSDSFNIHLEETAFSVNFSPSFCLYVERDYLT